jgi:HK97 family phage major capsid protein
MKSVNELNQQLANAVSFLDETRAKYEGKATMPADVEARFDQAANDMLDAKKELELRAELESARSFMMQPANGPAVMGSKTSNDVEDSNVRAWRQYLRGDSSQVQNIRAQQQVNPNTAGGFLVPTVILNEIIKPINDPIFMRQICRVNTIRGNVSVPRQTNRATSYWQGETETAILTNVTTGQREFKPHRVTVKTSNSRLLIEQSVIDVEQWLAEELDYSVRLKEEAAGMTGNGTGQWLGIFTASSDGISTNRDIETAGSGTIAADDILSTMMNVKATIRNRGSWVGSRQFVTTVMKLKDSANQYIFTESAGIGNVLAVGTPMTLKGRPLYESESAPTVFTAGNYPVVFGDFQYYHIYDFLNLAVQVLVEDPYASAGEYGYVMHKFSDGAPVLEEAFSRLKVKA